MLIMEPLSLRYMQDARTENARRPKDKFWQRALESWIERLNALEQLKQLAALADAGNRIAVAQMLHTWSEERVKQWGVEDLWTPLPFPIELGAGD
ncbi:hypothetical protein [Devosia sp.]|uniref:hypothetical protein n=1 Tax=Devosia sp. TaxID=1871048 RepID=UPI00326368AC